jgi:flavin reductase (DIM6/NTAB) family NADH-FMN oxidoreductase RutF
MKKRQLGPCVTFFPQPATLVVTRDAAGQSNIMMASWTGIVSKTPPTLAVSLHHSRRTYANISETGLFSVNMVPSHLVVEADFCGLASGTNLDKATITGLNVKDTPNGVPCLTESPLSVECRFTREVALGEYRLTLAEIVEINADEAAFDTHGSANVLAFDPLVYLGGLREYWSLGVKQADAYRAGLKLMP